MTTPRSRAVSPQNLEVIWKKFDILRGFTSSKEGSLSKWNNAWTSTRGRRALPFLIALFILATSFAIVSVRVQAAESTVDVTIKNYSFNPGNITVVIGVNNTVTWTNDDSVMHTVTANDNSFGKSLPPGSTFTYVFTTAGVFGYHCSIHTFMMGSVTVLAAPVSTASSTTTSSPTSSTSSSGAVSEFPLGVGAALVVAALVLASYLVIRQNRRN